LTPGVSAYTQRRIARRRAVCVGQDQRVGTAHDREEAAHFGSTSASAAVGSDVEHAQPADLLGIVCAASLRAEASGGVRNDQESMHRGGLSADRAFSVTA
jgi:hypothetical protein